MIETGNGAIENAEENLKVSSRHSATHGRKKHHLRRQIDEMELGNLRAKNKTVQRLRERQLELEQEREEKELQQRNGTSVRRNTFPTTTTTATTTTTKQQQQNSGNHV